MGWIRRQLTYANVMSTIAVFAALGGGAFAVAAASKNSVTSKSIKNSTIKGVDVLDDSLTGADVDEGSLSLQAGPQGPKGDKGDNGSPDTGAQILAKLKDVDGAGSDLDADELGGRQSCQTKPAVVISTGDSETLCEIGTSSLVGDCILNGSNQTVAFVQANSTGGKAAMGVAGADGTTNASGGSGLGLALDTTVDAGGPGPDGPGHGTFFVLREDGSAQLTGVVAAVAESTLPVGTCAFTAAGLG